MSAESSTPTHVTVVFPAERDIAGWELRHAAGEVPGRWPYGLDLLATDGVAVAPRAVERPQRLAAAWATRRPRRRQRPHETTDGAAPRDLGVAWDENAARRMLAQARRPEMYAGVIWVTDQVARGADARDLAGTRRALTAMDGLWVLSRPQMDAVRSFLGERCPPVHFVRFGVDADFFSPAPPAHSDARPLVLSVGGDRDRDPATLFDALADVHRACPDAEIVVQTRSTLTAPDGVRTVERFSHVELRDAYSRASVVAIATRQNLHVSGMTVSLEAMASARPVVVTDSPGMADYVVDGTTGLVTPSGDAAALADGVVTLLRDQDQAERLGRQARAHVEQSLTSAHLAAALRGVLGL